MVKAVLILVVLSSCTSFSKNAGLDSSNLSILIQMTENYLHNPQLFDQAMNEVSNAILHDSAYKPILGQPGIPDSMKVVAARYLEGRWNLISVMLISRGGLAALPKSPIVLLYEKIQSQDELLEPEVERFRVVYRMIDDKIYLVNVEFTGWSR